MLDSSHQEPEIPWTAVTVEFSACGQVQRVTSARSFGRDPSLGSLGMIEVRIGFAADGCRSWAATGAGLPCRHTIRFRSQRDTGLGLSRRKWDHQNRGNLLLWSFLGIWLVYNLPKEISTSTTPDSYESHGVTPREHGKLSTLLPWKGGFAATTVGGFHSHGGTPKSSSMDDGIFQEIHHHFWIFLG